MTKQQELIILSLVIGDGFFKGNQLGIVHCEKQLKYLEWKKKLLNECGIETTDIVKFNNSGYIGYKLYTKPYQDIKRLKKRIYNPKKKISKKLLKKLNPLSLAIWYMDDGGLSQKKANGKIVANDLMLNTGLQKEENQIIIDYFQEIWGIKFTQVKNHNVYRLRCGTKQARKFLDITKKYIEEVGCFDHKINIKRHKM